MRSWRHGCWRCVPTISALIVGATLGCSPEPAPTAPAPAAAPLTPTAASTPPQRAQLRPTVAAPAEPTAETRVPPIVQERPAPEGARPISVEADAVPDIGKAPLVVHFDARVDAGADSYECEWDFGDGTTATGNPVEHEFTAPGSYTVKVHVTTSGGATGSYPVGVEVDAPVDETGDDADLTED